MKNIITQAAFFLFISVSFVCCKKDDDDDNGYFPPAEETFTPEYIAPTQTGLIQLATRLLILKVGESGKIEAKLYESDGSVASPQPSFVYASDDATVASVANGTVTAMAVGETSINVTDGAHGIVHVNVVVLPSTGSTPDDTYSITFEPPVLSLKQGESGAFTYKIVDRKGNPASLGTPIFQFADFTDATISGNIITAGSSSGVFNLLALTGSDTLAGTLQVLFGLSGNTTTKYTIDEVFYPVKFNDNDLISKPIRVFVTETTTDGNGNSIISKYQTSPDQVAVLNTGVVTNSGGRLKSVHPGYAKLRITFKGTSVEGWTSVIPRLQGAWGDPAGICLEFFNPSPNVISYFSKGKYNFDLSLPALTYSLSCKPGQTFDATLSGSGKIDGFHGNPNSSMHSSIFPPNPSQWSASSGKLTDGYFLGSCVMSACTTQFGTIAPSTLFIWKDVDKIVLETSSSSNNYTLVRGQSCGGSGGFYKNTYSQFGASTSTSGTCTLSYSDIDVSANMIIPKDTGLFSIVGKYSITGTCVSAGSTGAFFTPSPIILTKNASNIWSGSGTGSFNAVCTVSNGTLSADGKTFNATVSVKVSGWNEIVKQVTLTKQ